MSFVVIGYIYYKAYKIFENIGSLQNITEETVKYKSTSNLIKTY